MKLGKLAVRHDPRTLHLKKYLAQFPTFPTVCDWGSKVPAWGMLKNDVTGDCTCASAGHMLMAWTSNDNTEFIPTDDQIISAYHDISGYDQKTGMNDNGAVELDVLKYWRKHGIAGRKILAFVKLEEKSFDHLKSAGWLFGGVYIGVSLPVEAQNQTVWDTTTGETPGSWGGHAVPVVGYNSVGPVVVTWGERKQMTWAAYLAWCDEAYAVLSNDWTGSDNLAPNGFNYVQLVLDLESVGDDPVGVSQSSLWSRFKQWLSKLFH
jgi:hypothetical protein